MSQANEILLRFSLQQNILVDKHGDDYKVCGVIGKVAVAEYSLFSVTFGHFLTFRFPLIHFLDFGDTSLSHYVFELAIAMAYMMIQSKELSTGGLVIAGYGMIRNIPEHERKVLKVCN